MWIYSVVLPLDSRRISTHSCWTCTTRTSPSDSSFSETLSNFFCEEWAVDMPETEGGAHHFSHTIAPPQLNIPISCDFITLIINNFMFYTIRPGTSDWDHKLITKEFFELRSVEREAHFLITSLYNQTCYNQRSHSLLDIRENAVTSYLS